MGYGRAGIKKDFNYMEGLLYSEKRSMSLRIPHERNSLTDLSGRLSAPNGKF